MAETARPVFLSLAGLLWRSFPGCTAVSTSTVVTGGLSGAADQSSAASRLTLPFLTMSDVGGLRDAAMWALLLLSVGVRACPHGCVCHSLADVGQWVYCSVAEGDPFPTFPTNTVVLNLQGNGLRSVPPGSLDHLMQLQDLRLTGNSWECGCHILYLKHWLEDHRVKASGTRCSLPDGSERSIRSLSGNEFPGCHGTRELPCTTHIKTLAVASCVMLLSIGLLSYATVVVRRIFVKARQSPTALRFMKY
ncbi:platelet glycoprotein IX-like [Arapaima gigas]